jgi:hypothetical protein
MVNVHLLEEGTHLWITYNRFSIAEKKRKRGLYYHCTCQNGTLHGAVDVRADGRETYKFHVCHFENRTSIADLMLQTHRAHEEKTTVPSPSYMPSLYPLPEATYDSWIYFQNSLDLSFRGAVSKPLLDFAHCLIKLGQQNPTSSPKELFQPIGRDKYSKMHRKLSIQAHTRTIELLNGQNVCCLFDATKVGEKQFLVTYLCYGEKEKPLFYSLQTDVSTQQQYAHYAASLCCELLTKNIKIVSFCTDGLKHQVRALSEPLTDESLFFPSATRCFLFFS